MFKRRSLLVVLLVCSLWQQYSCSTGDQQFDNNTVSSSEESKTSATNQTGTQQETSTLEKGITEMLDAGARSLEPWLKSISGLSKAIPSGGDGSNDPFKGIMNLIKPPTTTTPTPAATPEPQPHLVQQLTTGLGSIPASLGQGQLFETPVKVVEALTRNFNLTQVAESSPIGDIARVGEQTTKVLTKMSGIRLTAPPEDETVYYEYAPSDEWDGHRRPRYFSKECNFRFACEVGRMMKPMLAPVAQQFRTNKIVQDLQSRYSRAMSYGVLNDNCDKYYCVLLQLFGGPHKFVAASAEIVSQLATPEPIDG